METKKQQPTNEEKLLAIKLYVRRRRKESGIKEFPGAQPEPSCWLAPIGEFGNLVEFSLVYRPENEWNEFNNDQKLLDGVYGYVTFKPPKPKGSH